MQAYAGIWRRDKRLCRGAGNLLWANRAGPDDRHVVRMKRYVSGLGGGPFHRLSHLILLVISLVKHLLAWDWVLICVRDLLPLSLSHRNLVVGMLRVPKKLLLLDLLLLLLLLSLLLLHR